jgi:hypothetical protein
MAEVSVLASDGRGRPRSTRPAPKLSPAKAGHYVRDADYLRATSRKACAACESSPFGTTPQLPRISHLGNLHRDQLLPFDFGDAHAPRQQRHSHLFFDRSLDAFEARQRYLYVDGRVPNFGLPQD